MTSDEWEKFLYESMKAAKFERIELPERDNLLMTLNHLEGMVVGQFDRFFCNLFLSEMVQLLINSVFLYEDGYFDSAFYSIRQAGEVGNSMLYIASEGKAKLNEWDKKLKFPMNSEIIKKLKKIDEFYKEVHDQAIPEFFAEQEKLIKQCHKIIHKQGFDTFYSYRRAGNSFNKADEVNLFYLTLKHTIATAIILYIITDPISLVLADEELSMHFNFDPMCEPADVTFIEREFSPDIITKIKDTKWFFEFSQFFIAKEKMLPEVAVVIREQFFDLLKLDSIKSQSNLLSTYERIILEILQKDIKVTHIYPDCMMLGYDTSIHSNYCPRGWSSQEYTQYLGKEEAFNMPYYNVFRSIFYGLSDNWIFEHNEPLSADEISGISNILSAYRKEYQKLDSLFKV